MPTDIIIFWMRNNAQPIGGMYIGRVKKRGIYAKRKKKAKNR